MNNRLEELAWKAGLVQDHWANADVAETIWKEDSDNPGALKKFAELIIKDCTDLLEAELKEQREMIVFNESDDRWRLGKVSHFTHVIKKIKAHFKGRV